MNANKKCKYLVATRETQGERENDFFFPAENEIVTFVKLECDGEEIDGDCGCRRSMSGTTSLTSTTTSKVIEGSIDDLWTAVENSYTASGWAEYLNKVELHKIIVDEVETLINVGNAFPVGTILEKRGNKFVARSS